MPDKPEAKPPFDMPPHLRKAAQLHPDVLETLGRALVKTGLQFSHLETLRQGREQIALAQKLRQPPNR